MDNSDELYYKMCILKTTYSNTQKHELSFEPWKNEMEEKIKVWEMLVEIAVGYDLESNWFYCKNFWMKLQSCMFEWLIIYPRWLRSILFVLKIGLCDIRRILWISSIGKLEFVKKVDMIFA